MGAEAPDRARPVRVVLAVAGVFAALAIGYTIRRLTSN